MSDRTVSAFQQRRGSLRDSVVQDLVQQTAGLDPDLWVVMDQRDNTLIEQEILHGAGSSKYVYDFRVAGSQVSGISVIGARELAATYGGIQHSLVGSIAKLGQMFIMKSYRPMDLRVQMIPELAAEPDYYEVLAEIKDVKTGNTVMAERRETRLEKRSADARNNNPDLPEWYERPHYQTIAQSKAYRNGVLSLIPQHVQLEWKQEMLTLKKTDIITGSVLAEKQSGVLRYGAAKAIGLDRHAVEGLTLDQISGLSDAIREGRTEQFVHAAEALGLVVGTEESRANTSRSVQVKGNGSIPPNAPAESKAPAKEDKTPAKKAGPAAGEASGPTTKAPDKPAEKPAESKAPAATGQAGAAAAKEQPADPPTAEEPKANPDLDTATTSTFDSYPVDEFGEPIALFDGAEFLNYTRPLDFAQWYVERVAHSANKLALMENNQDALTEAAEDPAAKAVLDAWEAQQKQGNEATQPPPSDSAGAEAAEAASDIWMPVTMDLFPNRKTNWAKYVKECETDLAARVHTEADLDKWLAANGPTYVGKSFAFKVDELTAARRIQVSGQQPDRDADEAKRIIGMLDEARYRHEYDALIRNAAVRSWAKKMSEERPELRAMLLEADKRADQRTYGHTAPGAEEGATAS